MALTEEQRVKLNAKAAKTAYEEEEDAYYGQRLEEERARRKNMNRSENNQADDMQSQSAYSFKEDLKNTGRKLIKIVLIVGVILFIGNRMNAKNDRNSSYAHNKSTTVSDARSLNENKQENVRPTYHQYTVGQLIEERHENELRASNNHKGEYVILDGYVCAIPNSSNKYFAIDDGSEITFSSIACYYSSSDANKVMQLNKDDHVVVMGKIQDTGLVYDYKINVSHFEKLEYGETVSDWIAKNMNK